MLGAKRKGKRRAAGSQGRPTSGTAGGPVVVPMPVRGPPPARAEKGTITFNPDVEIIELFDNGEDEFTFDNVLPDGSPKVC